MKRFIFLLTLIISSLHALGDQIDIELTQHSFGISDEIVMNVEATNVYHNTITLYSPYAYRVSNGNVFWIDNDMKAELKPGESVSFTIKETGISGAGTGDAYAWIIVLSYKRANDDNTYVIKYKAEMFNTSFSFISSDAPEDVEPEFVDLGLPSKTMWAKNNLGATDSNPVGWYLSWGESNPKKNYAQDTYKYWNKSEKYTKYCFDSAYGVVDNLRRLEPIDDAAYINLGENWHLPTLEQTQELISNCTCKPVTENGINGYQFTASNGNSIFFPAGGVMITINNFFNTDCVYLTSDIFDASNGHPNFADIFYIENGEPHWWYGWGREYGYNARAVSNTLSSDINKMEVAKDEVTGIFDVNGIKVNKLKKGINIIKYRSGKVKKVFVANPRHATL